MATTVCRSSRQYTSDGGPTGPCQPSLETGEERLPHAGDVANTNDHRKIETDALFASFYKEMTGLELQNDALAMLNSQITAIESAAREISQ